MAFQIIGGNVELLLNLVLIQSQSYIFKQKIKLFCTVYFVLLNLFTMKKILWIIVLLPLMGIAQIKSSKTKKKKEKPEAGFIINGSVEGYPDGTIVDFLNGNNRNPEGTTKLQNGKFVFKGNLQYPDFKLISFNKSSDFIVLFIDNSIIDLQVKAGELDKAIVKGSASNDDFFEFNKITKPYQNLFMQEPEAITDIPAKNNCLNVLTQFINKHQNSYITPLAIFRHHQLNNDDAVLEQMYNGLKGEIKLSPIGAYLAQMIDEAKKNPMGKVIPDFQQADVNGNMVNVQSFRGKYVLVDFWASWCGPCRGENPNVVKAFNKYKDKNFTVLGVSLDKTKNAWLDAINADGLTWTHVSDLKGWGNEVAAQFGITSIPQNLLIDPNGIVIGRNLRGAALEAKLETIFK